MKTGTKTIRRRDRIRQRFFFENSDFWCWCSLGVWNVYFSSHDWRIRNVLMYQVYICNIPTYNSMPKIQGLILQWNYFWRDWNIWFQRVRLSGLGLILFGTCPLKKLYHYLTTWRNLYLILFVHSTIPKLCQIQYQKGSLYRGAALTVQQGIWN